MEADIEVKVKNGYVKIANNLFDNIIFRDFTNRERAVIFLIIRLSYGFNHKAAIIKPKARFGLIGVHRQNIDRTLDSLVNKGVIIKRNEDEYALNKHFNQWQVRFNKHFNEDEFNALKGLQFRGYVITPITENNKEDVITTITNCNQNNNSDVITTITNCNQENKEDVITTITDLKKCNHHDYAEVITTITKNNNLSSPRLQGQGENEDGDNNLDGSKDIFKDNIKTFNKDIYIEDTQKNESKKIDPYFNNPIVEKFKEEYAKNFNTKNCYLDNFKIKILTEMYTDNPEIINQMPEIVKKYSKLNFSNGIGRPSLKWLLNDGNWSGILNGDYDKYLEEEEVIDGWTL